MSNLGATYDQQVIDAWAVQLGRRKRGIGKTQLVLFLALIPVGIWMFLMPSLVLILLFFCVILALVFAQLIDRFTLLCPHCHQSPAERGASDRTDFCMHCYYWLKSPYGDNHGKAV